jgi:hypothetical protein
MANPEKIVAAIPVVKVFQLVAKIIKLSKGGLSKEEALDLLEDLAEIAVDVAAKVK